REGPSPPRGRGPLGAARLPAEGRDRPLTPSPLRSAKALWTIALGALLIITGIVLLVVLPEDFLVTFSWFLIGLGALGIWMGFGSTKPRGGSPSAQPPTSSP